MIIYLYGPDSYRRGKKLTELISSYKEKHPALDLRFFDFEEDENLWISARDFLEQPSMFRSAKCAVIYAGTAVDKKSWIQTLASYSEAKDVFIMISEDAKPKKAFSFLTKKPCISQEFAELVGVNLDRFLKLEAKSRGLVFTPPAWKFFSEYVLASNIWTGIRTLEKIELAQFSQPISLGDVERITDWFSRDKVFSLMRECGGNLSWKKKIAFLEKAIIQKEDPAYLFNSLSFGARGNNLLYLAEYDISIKSGVLEYEEALLDFVLK